MVCIRGRVTSNLSSIGNPWSHGLRYPSCLRSVRYRRCGVRPAGECEPEVCEHEVVSITVNTHE